MAKIKVVDRSVLQTGRPIDATQPAGPLSVVGNQVAKLGEEYQRKEHQSFISNEVTTRYANYIKADAEFTQTRSSDQGRYATLVGDWQKNSTELRNQAFKNLTDPDAKRILAERITNYSSRQSINVSSHARKLGVNAAREQTLASLETLRDQSITARNSDVPDIMLAASDNIALQVDSGIYTKAQGEKILKKFNGEVQEGRILQMMRNNPAGALKILKGNKTLPGINPARHLQLQRAAQSLVKQNQAVTSQEFIKVKKDDINSLKSLGKGEPGLLAKIYAAEGKKAGDEHKRLQGVALKIHAGNQLIKGGNREDINKFLTAEIAKVKPGKGFTLQSALVAEYSKTARRKFQLMRDDPIVNYKENPAIQALDSEVTATLAAAGPVGEFLNASDNELVQGIGRIFSKSITSANVKRSLVEEKLLALQRADKVGEEKLRLLTNGEAVNLVTTYNNTKPDQRHQFFAALRGQYGDDRYKIVFRDMVRHGKLPVEASIMNSFATNPNGVQLTADLARGIELGQAALQKDVSGEDITLLENTINTKLNEYFASSEYNLSALTIKFENDLKKSIKTIALVRMRTQGLSADQAASVAADEAINSRYNYVDLISRRPISLTRSLTMAINARIPVRYDTQRVLLQTIVKLDQLRDFKPVPGGSVVLPGATLEFRRNAYIEKIIETGRWVTNKNDDGLILVDPGGNPVINDNGNTFGFSFDSTQ